MTSENTDLATSSLYRRIDELNAFNLVKRVADDVIVYRQVINGVERVVRVTVEVEA